MRSASAMTARTSDGRWALIESTCSRESSTGRPIPARNRWSNTSESPLANSGIVLAVCSAPSPRCSASRTARDARHPISRGDMASTRPAYQANLDTPRPPRQAPTCVAPRAFWQTLLQLCEDWRDAEQLSGSTRGHLTPGHAGRTTFELWHAAYMRDDSSEGFTMPHFGRREFAYLALSLAAGMASGCGMGPGEATPPAPRATRQPQVPKPVDSVEPGFPRRAVYFIAQENSPEAKVLSLYDLVVI